MPARRRSERLAARLNEGTPGSHPSRTSVAAPSEVDWTLLSQDALLHVAALLADCRDLGRFPQVCQVWRQALAGDGGEEEWRRRLDRDFTYWSLVTREAGGHRPGAGRSSKELYRMQAAACRRSEPPNAYPSADHHVPWCSDYVVVIELYLHGTTSSRRIAHVAIPFDEDEPGVAPDRTPDGRQYSFSEAPRVEGRLHWEVDAEEVKGFLAADWLRDSRLHIVATATRWSDGRSFVLYRGEAREERTFMGMARAADGTLVEDKAFENGCLVYYKYEPLSWMQPRVFVSGFVALGFCDKGDNAAPDLDDEEGAEPYMGRVVQRESFMGVTFNVFDGQDVSYDEMRAILHIAALTASGC